MKVVMETPPIHPGLVDLERANLIPYLPTWPEPDPPSDVIGFINVRDANKPVQSHLMRSEQFETSQAIRFRDPIGKTEEPLTKKATQEPQPENPGTASCNASEDTQRAKNEAERDSQISMTFEECHDSTESATPATECPGSGNSEVQKLPDEPNTSTVSQPATEQHPQRQPPNQPKPGVIQNHTDVYVNANSKKLNQTTPRPPASNIRSQQASQGRGGAKMAAAKPDGCVQPAKVEGIGRHAFWQGKQLAQGRPGQGYPPRSQDKPASYRSSSTGRMAQGQQEDRPNLLTRSSSFRLPQEQMGRSRPGHQGPPGHRQQLLPQGDGHASFGLPFTRFSHLKTMKGKMAEGPLGSLQRKAPLESKGAV
ncbi:hypothetical protein AGOR_G00228010 [Albula goreensis]|uniref:Uncharacterized protein n=1 Tax=Albula goreensis TaxID=1534307 RepID=A0A8T3CJE3_9TELE|nr:hypothetical protein AGOR_G00228010 [Albula goreensis]